MFTYSVNNLDSKNITILADSAHSIYSSQDPSSDITCIWYRFIRKDKISPVRTVIIKNQTSFSRELFTIILLTFLRALSC